MPYGNDRTFSYKTEKEYLCIRDGEERGFTAAEFLHAQNEGWEKQYPYLVGKKKIYMTTVDGEAQGLKRASKHPKSTTYGRQNPITERWNSESQLILWRSAWAYIVNLHLARICSDERVDHRSHTERGLDEQPTIHEGVAARAMEKKGMVAARCEINRQIRADNALLRELKELVKNLSKVVADTAASIGEKLAQLRENMIVFCYQRKRIALGKDKMSRKLNAVQPLLKQYTEVIRQIKQKVKTRKALLAEQMNTSKLNLIKQHDLSKQITTLTEEIEELRSEKENLLLNLDCTDDAGIKAVQSEVTAMEVSLRRLDEQEEQYSNGLDDALQQYKDLQKQSEPIDMQQQQQVASASAAARLQKEYGGQYNPKLLREAKQGIARMLHEPETPRSIRAQLNRERSDDRTQPSSHNRNESVR